MASPYTLPPTQDELDGACAFADGLCTWHGRTAHLWRPNTTWTALSEAPTAIDSIFELQSGVLAGADTHVGFLPDGATDWAGWVDLSDFSDAHPLYGDLLLCTNAETDVYTLFSVSASGLNPISTFESDELADPVAGWSAPTTPDRLLLLGEGGLWALSSPYTASSLQHLVSFEDVELPPFEEFPGFFQPGVATVVIPRRTRTALRLDLSDGTGHATGLAHLQGSAALWTAYLDNDRERASRLLAALATLPSPPGPAAFRLHDLLVNEGELRALATSAGVLDASEWSTDATASDLAASPLDEALLTTWGLWLEWDGALDAACRQLCNRPGPNLALAESLQVFAGTDAVEALFDLLRSDDPPTGPEDEYAFPVAALRAVVAPVGEAVAPLVAEALTDAAVPARVAACIAAGATRADLDSSAPDDADPAASVLWGGDHALPEADLRAGAHHDHPAVRAAARATCARLSIETAPSPQASS